VPEIVVLLVIRGIICIMLLAGGAFTLSLGFKLLLRRRREDGRSTFSMKMGGHSLSFSSATAGVMVTMTSMAWVAGAVISAPRMKVGPEPGGGLDMAGAIRSVEVLSHVDTLMRLLPPCPGKTGIMPGIQPDGLRSSLPSGDSLAQPGRTDFIHRWNGLLPGQSPAVGDGGSP
jgi:hypothetical protein